MPSTECSCRRRVDLGRVIAEVACTPEGKRVPLLFIAAVLNALDAAGYKVVRSQ